MNLKSLTSALVVSSSVLLFACGPSDTTIGGSGGGGGKASDAGNAGGGAGGGTASGCAPGAVEICGDGVDNDCNGQIDEIDADHDGVTCATDCNDSDPTVHPGATEVLNNVDDNCDGKIDNDIVGQDYDGDGFLYQSGTQPDCNDNDPLIGPNAVEVPGDNIDNNCNGQVDEPVPSCETGVTITSTSANDFLKAMELCWPVTSASFTGNSAAREIRTNFGNATDPKAPSKPKAGSKYIMLSSGKALDQSSASPQGSASYNPDPGDDFSGGSCFASTCDEVTLTVKLKTPQNAKSFSFDFAFYSAEFPEYVGSQFNDQFVAELTSAALPASFQAATCGNGQSGCKKGNVSFDGNGKPVSVNNNYFIICKKTSTSQTSNCSQPVSLLNGTGYEIDKGGESNGGGTGWLTTTAPVKPNEQIIVVFHVFDQADGILDSAVLIDNFRWGTLDVTGPTTVQIN